MKFDNSLIYALNKAAKCSQSHSNHCKYLFESGRKNTWMWIGGHKVGRYFRWDGIHQGRIIYTDWKNGEPNNAGGVENCIESHGSGEWNDTRCSFFFGYVCEKRA